MIQAVYSYNFVKYPKNYFPTPFFELGLSYYLIGEQITSIAQRKEKDMFNKKLIAMGLTTLMVASTPLTALAAGPGGPGDDHGGSDRGAESHSSEEAHHDDGGHDAPPPQESSSEHSQPGGGAPSGNQDFGQQTPPSMPSGQDNAGQDNGGQTPPSMPSQSGDMGLGGQQMPGQPGQNDQMMPPQQGMGEMQPGQQQQDAEWYRQVQQVINQILEEMGQPTITLDDLTAMMGIPSQAPEDRNDRGPGAGNQNGSSMQNGKPENGGPDMQNSNQSGRPEMQDNGQGGPGGKPDGMGGSSAPTEYTAANTVTEDVSDQSYSSEANSENAVLVDGKAVSMSGLINHEIIMEAINPTVEKATNLTSKKNTMHMTKRFVYAQKSVKGQIYDIPFHCIMRITAIVYFAAFNLWGYRIPLSENPVFKK